MTDVRSKTDLPRLNGAVILQVIDERLRRVTPAPEAIGKATEVYTDEEEGGAAEVDTGSGTAIIDVANNSTSQTLVIGGLADCGTVYIEYSGYRNTKYWSGKLVIQMFGASTTDTNDSEETGDATVRVREYAMQGGGDCLDSNGSVHIVWDATLNGTDVELTATATDDTDAVVLTIRYSCMEEVT